MYQRTERIRIADIVSQPTPVEPLPLLAVSGEIRAGDRKDVAVPRPRRLVIVRGMRRYFG